MLALDAILILAPKNEKLSFGNYLPLRAEKDQHNSHLLGKLILKIEIPLNAKLAFETVARAPADRPIVCAALAQWPSGRTRLALGGYGKSPILALDGNEPGGVENAASNAFVEAADEWASAEYRSEIAAVLAKRCLEK
jgi:CO/xanthine dehydrogenase FAD-binding subunit